MGIQRYILTGINVEYRSSSHWWGWWSSSSSLSGLTKATGCRRSSLPLPSLEGAISLQMSHLMAYTALPAFLFWGSLVAPSVGEGLIARLSTL